MDILNSKDIAVMGRKQNAVVLEYERSIVITTDILKHNQTAKEPHITLDDVQEKVEVFAKDVELAAKNSTRDPESVVYGESLVELLRWIIDVLKTHKHPPNASPIPDFYSEANSRSRSMEDDLLNKHVRTR